MKKNNGKIFRNTCRKAIVWAMSLSLMWGTVPAMAEDFAWTEETESAVSDSPEYASDPAQWEEPEVEEITDAQEATVSDGTSDTDPVSGANGGEEFFTEDTDFVTEVTETSEEDPDIRYIKGRPLTEEELAAQRSLEKVGGSMLAPEEADSNLYSYARAFAADLPSKYDMRDYGRITSVKNQGRSWGICWAFSLASLMESSLLQQGLGEYDLSEEHLAYFLYNHQNDPLGNTEHDRTVNKDGYHEGGNGIMGVTHLSSWSGMTTEADVPMQDSLEGTIPDISKAYHATAYLKNANVSGYGITRTKNLITNYSSVGILLYYGSGYMSWDTAAYACPKGYDSANNDKTINHMVTLVGWDDTYSHKNFNSNSGISTDGAWIAKNSWGEEWGDHGYFYISYQDASLSGLVTVEAMLSTSYPNNYFYDGTALNKYISLNQGESVANIFTAKAGDGKAEVLGEVNVFTYNDNTKYSVKIYTNLTDASNPASGTLAATLNCQQSYAGIRTLTMPEVTLLPGAMYAVVVTNTNSAGVLKLAAECTQNASWVYTEAEISYGQSFYSAGSLKNWKDWADPATYTLKEAGNRLALCMRIKAHTRTTDQIPALALSANDLTFSMGSTKTLSSTVTPKTYGGDAGIFTSGDASVVSVTQTDSKSVSLTGLRPGTATVTVKSRFVPDLTQDCTVTVNYAPPSALKAVSKRYDRIALTWKASESSPVTGYQIYRKAADQTEKKIATVAGKVTSYTDQSLLTGTTYTYRVRAYTKYSAKDLVYSAFTDTVSAVPGMAVSTCKAMANHNMYHTITWNKIAGAKGYYIYRRLAGGKWARVKTITNASITSWKDSQIKALASYEYAVRAYRVVSGKTIRNSYEASNTVIASASRQKIKTLSSVSNGIKITWTPQKKASGYRVYRKTPNGKWTRLKQISGGSASSFIDTKAKKNTTYYYAVRAYIDEPYGTRLLSFYTAKKVTR